MRVIFPIILGAIRERFCKRHEHAAEISLYIRQAMVPIIIQSGLGGRRQSLLTEHHDKFNRNRNHIVGDLFTFRLDYLSKAIGGFVDVISEPTSYAVFQCEKIHFDFFLLQKVLLIIVFVSLLIF